MMEVNMNARVSATSLERQKTRSQQLSIDLRFAKKKSENFHFKTFSDGYARTIIGSSISCKHWHRLKLVACLSFLYASII
jgi:hypothetical protein